MGERPPRKVEWAAGGVVHRRANGEAEYLLIHRPRYDDWSLPKGHAEPGELLVESALREVREETGVVPIADRLIGTVAYDAGSVLKVVRWWTMEGDGEFTDNGEVDELRWLPFAAATETLTYDNDRRVLRRAHRLVAGSGAGTVLLVRHAVAGKRSEWDAPDPARPLDESGRAQALALRDLLQATPVTRIVSSGYRRCVQTVAPLGKRLGIPVETAAVLEERHGPEGALELVGRLRGESAVLCSHGDVVGGIVRRLFDAGVPMAGPESWEKGSVWILETEDGAPVAGSYLPPPS